MNKYTGEVHRTGLITKTQDKEKKQKPYKRKTLLTILALTTFLTACNEKGNMHLAGQSYIHKELSEEEYLFEEKKDDGTGAVSSKRKYSYVGYTFSDKAMGTYLDEATGGSSEGGSSESIILNAITAGNLYLPLATSKLTWHAQKRDGRWHSGADFAAPPGTPISAAHDGRVYIATSSGTKGLGNHVVLEATMNGKTIRTWYGHMLTYPPVIEGQDVKKGDNIGQVGNSGASQGNHLHLEVQLVGATDADLLKEYSQADLTFAKANNLYSGPFDRAQPGNYFAEFSRQTPSYTQVTRNN